MTPTPAPEHDPGTTTRSDFERVDAAVIAAAAKLPTATLHEGAGKIGALPSAIKPVGRGMKICGPALTIHSPPGDNLWLHRALAIARPGDVLVVFANGAYEYGYWGEIMSTMSKVRGLGGLVVDGCVRDGVLLEEIGFPVCARGLCMRGTGKDYGAIGWINAPVQIGEIVIEPGDLIVADGDGVLALPRARAAELVKKAEQREADEARILERLKAGESTMQVYGFH